MNTRRFLLGGLTSILTISAVACGEDPPPAPPSKYDFPIEVQAEDSNRNPLAKVPVTIDGGVVGYTDADGKFTASLNELAGNAVTVGVQDIDGYRFPEGSVSVTENLRVTTVNGEESGVPVFLQVTGEPLRKDYFVWVRANCEKGLETDACADLPVKLNGEEVGKTNRFGYAHFAFQDVPQNDVEIVIETGSEADYKPANPLYAMTLNLDSHVYLIDETFADPEFQERKPRRRRSTNRKSRSSKQKTSAPAKKPPAEKKKDNGVIDFDW